MATYGLVNTEDNSCIPLKTIQIKSQIQGYFAHVATKYLYENKEDNPIEASFVFPLDERCAIYKFEAVIEGRLICGEVQTKEQAKETYDDAIAAGESAFLMEEDDEAGDVFECKVGNLPPKTEAEITFSYVTELDFTSDGHVQFVYPCILRPRYSVSDENEHDTEPPVKRNKSTHKTLAIVDEVTYRMDISVNISAPKNSGKKIISVTHNYEKRKQCKALTVDAYQVKVTDSKFDKDFELIFCYTDRFGPHITVERGSHSQAGLLKEDMAMVEFQPDFSPRKQINDAQKAEYVFIIDRSGSMGGDRIESAKKALKAFLENLPNDCFFNIISFGSTFEMLFPNRSALKTDDRVQLAQKLQEEMNSDMGGTEMLRPFKALYRQKPIPDYPRKVILLTDGAIWGEDKLISLIKKGRSHTQVFAFGIGFGASTSLVRGVARAGMGKSEFLRDDNKKLKEKVLKVLEWAGKPVLSDVKVTYKLPSEVQAVPIPTELPCIILGESCVAYAVLKNLPKGSCDIKCTLTAKAGNSNIKHELHTTVPSKKKSAAAASNSLSDSLPVHRIAAKAQIKELQDDEQYAGVNKEKIELVSIAANLVSRYTSFVGVDKGRIEKVKGQMTRRVVPLSADKQKKVSSTAMAALAPPPIAAAAALNAPRCYGGGPSDSTEAQRYLGGKETNILPDKKDDADQADCMDIFTPATRKKIGEEMPIKELATELETTKLIYGRDSSVRGDGGGRGCEVRAHSTYTTPEHKACKNCWHSKGKCVFAKWFDGNYYPGKLGQSADKSLMIQFADSFTKSATKPELLRPGQLRGGDEVAVTRNQHGVFQWAMMLEYCSDDDMFTVAMKDGDVQNINIGKLMISAQLAKEMMSRPNRTELDSKQLCSFEALDGQAHFMETSDLAELKQDGWINQVVVELFIRKLWSVQPSGIQKITHIFSPVFFSELSLDIPEHMMMQQARALQKRCYALRSQSAREQRFERVINWVKALNIRQKKALFVPIYDEGHWYLVFITLTHSTCKKVPTVDAEMGVMDSYFQDNRTYETMLIKEFLHDLCEKQGMQFRCSDTVTTYPVPIQSNLSDCGICTLLCLQKTLQENLQPAAHLDWFSAEDALNTRQQLAKDVLHMWER